MQEILSRTVVLFIAALFVFASPTSRAEDTPPVEVQKPAEPEKPAAEIVKWLKDTVPGLFAMDLSTGGKDMPATFTKEGWDSFLKYETGAPKEAGREWSYGEPLLIEKAASPQGYRWVYRMLRNGALAGRPPQTEVVQAVVQPSPGAPDGLAFVELLRLTPSVAQQAPPAQAPRCPNLKPGTFGGIGMIPHMSDNELRVMKVIEGKPADRAGLRIGDQITEIDGKAVTGMTLCDVIGLIRGDIGSTVTLKIIRKAETLSVPIVREQIQWK